MTQAIQVGEHYDGIMKLPCVYRAEKNNGEWSFVMLDMYNDVKLAEKGDWIIEENGQYILKKEADYER